MRDTSLDPTDPMPLRTNAEARLTAGAAPPTRWTLGTDALSLLFRLASSPDTAGEGLKLLHELQVHQVELDLLHEEFESTEQQLAGSLLSYRSYFDHAPVGYFVVGLDGCVIEGNLAAAALLGVGRETLRGRPLAGLLAPERREPLLALLEKLNDGAAEASCRVLSPAGESRPLQINASRSPGGGAFLVIACGCGA